MRKTRSRMMWKALSGLLILAVVSCALIGFVSFYYMGQISEFSRLSNISLGNTAADHSSAAIAKQNEEKVQEKALDVAEEVRIYLMGRSGLDAGSLSTNTDFAKIAVQAFGKTGETWVYEKTTGTIRVHSDRTFFNNDLHEYETQLPDFWKLFSASLSGTGSSGYCDLIEEDGFLYPVFMYFTPVIGTSYMVAASMNVTEFTEASDKIRDEINAAALSSSEYINQQKTSMYRAFIIVIVGILVVVAALAFWMARRITRPILALTNGSRIIADGNFDHKVEVRTGDEIEELADQYNRMAATLKESYANLEQKVETRTAELRQANELLHKEISQREKMEYALRQSEVRYRHLVEKANCIILEMDTEGKVIFFNKFGLDFFGYSESEIVGRSVMGTIVPVQDSAGKDLGDMIKDLVSHPDKYTFNENENVRRSGDRVWVVWLNQPLYDKENNLTGVLCIGLDRTEMKHAEELREKQAKESAAAAERNRLARDLHDAVSQTLFSASIIADVLPRLWEKSPAEGVKRLNEIRELTRGALAEMRTLLLELRPSALMEAEMGVLLQQLGESVTGRARLPVAVEVSGNCEVPVDVKVAFYRIAQEALNNAAKHSGAKQVWVNMECLDSEVRLSIKDNGKGFDLENISPDSLGVGIMQERSRNIGASFNLDSKLGEGTLVSVVWKP